MACGALPHKPPISAPRPTQPRHQTALPAVGMRQDNEMLQTLGGKRHGTWRGEDDSQGS